MAERHKLYYAADPENKRRAKEWKSNNRARVRANEAAWREAFKIIVQAMRSGE